MPGGYSITKGFCESARGSVAVRQEPAEMVHQLVYQVREFPKHEDGEAAVVASDVRWQRVRIGGQSGGVC